MSAGSTRTDASIPGVSVGRYILGVVAYAHVWSLHRGNNDQSDKTKRLFLRLLRTHGRSLRSLKQGDDFERRFAVMAAPVNPASFERAIAMSIGEILPEAISTKGSIAGPGYQGLVNKVRLHSETQKHVIDALQGKLSVQQMMSPSSNSVANLSGNKVSRSTGMAMMVGVTGLLFFTIYLAGEPA